MTWPKTICQLSRLWPILWKQAGHSHFAWYFSCVHLLLVGRVGMSHCVYVSLTCCNLINNNWTTLVRFSISYILLPEYIFVNDSRHKKTTFIAGMETGITSLSSWCFVSLVLRTQLILIRYRISVILFPYDRCVVVVLNYQHKDASQYVEWHGFVKHAE